MVDPAGADLITWHVATIVAGAVSTTVVLTWFISKEFSKNRGLFYKALSLHNKEDDDRFEALSNDIWRIHLRNAQRDGDDPPERKTFPRRRYLQEVIDNGTG